jgi:hypothetical protein
MESGLGLSVINTGSHYAARVKNYREMTKRHYRTYILGLVTDEARKQRIQFGVKAKSADINIAVDEVLDHMQAHMLEMVEGPDDRKPDEDKDAWLGRVYG